jgi:hypothetical protein
VQAEGFAAAHAGAEVDFEDVGVLVGVGLGAVVEEGCGLPGSPAQPFVGGGPVS